MCDEHSEKISKDKQGFIERVDDRFGQDLRRLQLLYWFISDGDKSYEVTWSHNLWLHYNHGNTFMKGSNLLGWTSDSLQIIIIYLAIAANEGHFLTVTEGPNMLSFSGAATFHRLDTSLMTSLVDP